MFSSRVGRLDLFLFGVDPADAACVQVESTGSTWFNVESVGMT
jgi:hypothetical protein